MARFGEGEPNVRKEKSQEKFENRLAWKKLFKDVMERAPKRQSAHGQAGRLAERVNKLLEKSGSERRIANTDINHYRFIPEEATESEGNGSLGPG